MLARLLIFTFLFSFQLVCANPAPTQHSYTEKEMENKVWFGSASYLIGHHSYKPEDEVLSSYTSGINLTAGIHLLPIASIESAFTFWLDSDEEEDNLEDSITHSIFHDFHFEGASVGVNGIIHLPIKNSPFVKFGRHCWSLEANEVLNIWDGSGCSNLSGAGITLGKKMSGLRLELNYIRYKEVKTMFFSIGLGI
ncbi:hypothetical protein NBRC116188_09410 [Oceaniserpentilla sp. 4NH20-0058]|uniref:hypothetical protein n=1 Tax=Oceaniserpentilla sp. 4NH20-0058 TaxID=3127660 RepID=UPI00310B634B